MISVSMLWFPSMNSFQIEVRHCIPNFEASLVADIFGLVNLWQNVALFIRFTISMYEGLAVSDSCFSLLPGKQKRIMYIMFPWNHVYIVTY